MANLVNFRKCTYSEFAALTVKEDNSLYFLTDTHQIFKGASEYTKGTKVLTSQPKSSTVGEIGALYAYNGSLYLCSSVSGSSYTYVRVANVNDESGTVSAITVGEGLATASGDTTITVSGTIEHDIPSGVSSHTSSVESKAVDFGESFKVAQVSTDKFGHASVSDVDITIPKETAVTVETATGAATKLNAGDKITVVTEVSTGSANQSVKRTSTTFTLPDDKDTTYTLSSTSEGKILVTPSSGSSYSVTINGWDTLAKKADISSVFIYKGTVAKVSDLPASAEVGYVYHVTERSAEYACVTASTSSSDAVYEELGSEIDLTAYAKSADVIQRVTGSAGNVPKFNSDGTLSSTGFTLGVSVPANAKFTDTTYSDATQSSSGLMSSSDKAKLDKIESGAQVNTVTGVKGAAESTYRTGNINITLANLGVTVSAGDLNSVTNKLDKTATAASATADASGNVITTTYATKDELTTALSWKSVTD